MASPTDLSVDVMSKALAETSDPSHWRTRFLERGLLVPSSPSFGIFPLNMTPNEAAAYGIVLRKIVQRSKMKLIPTRHAWLSLDDMVLSRKDKRRDKIQKRSKTTHLC
jgi:hypothetical protein